MDLFTYLMAKNGHNTSVHGDLFSYLLGKGQSQTQTISGVTIYIPDAKKLVSFMMTKESTQDGEPTPDNPVEVKTVKGYRNLFDKDNVDWYRNNNDVWGTHDNISSDRIKSSEFAIFGDKKYVVSGYPSTVSLIGIRTYDSNHTYLGYADRQNNKFSLNLNVTYIHLLFSGSNFTNETNELMKNSNIQIVEGTEEHPYVPYGNNYVDVKVVGKNLFNKNAITEFQKLEADGTLSSAGSFSTSDFIEIDSTKTYHKTETGSTRVKLYDKNKNVISTDSFEDISAFSGAKTFTIPYSNAKYIRFTFQNTRLDTIQIEEGSTATEYEPYKETIAPIPLNNNEIVGIGDYKDELIVDKSGHVWLNKLTGKYIFTGNENWIQAGTSAVEDTSRFFVDYDDIYSIPANPNFVYVLSNKFKGDTWRNLYSENIIDKNLISNYIDKQVGRFEIRIDNTIASTLEEFKEYLQTQNNNGTPVITYYVKATSQLIDLNTTVDLKLFKGVNNVSNSEDGYMTIEYQ